MFADRPAVAVYSAPSHRRRHTRARARPDRHARGAAAAAASDEPERSADPARRRRRAGADRPAPDDAHMPETTRRPLIEVAKRYGVVACVSGRRASDARRIVVARLDRLPRLARLGGAAAGRDRAGARPRAAGLDAAGAGVRPRRVRREAAPAARAAGGQGGDRRLALARRARRGGRAGGDRGRSPKRAEEAGFVAHWGRKVLEIRPPVRIDKGAGIVRLLRDTRPRRRASTSATT